MRTWLIAILVVSIPTVASSSPPKPPESIIILDVAAYGHTRDNVARKFSDAVKIGLATAGYLPIAPKRIRDCPLDNECLAELSQRFGSHRFLRVGVETSRGKRKRYVFTLTFIELRDGVPQIKKLEPDCVSCTQSQAEATLRKALRQHLPSVRRQPPTRPVPQPQKPKLRKKRRFGKLKWASVGIGVTAASAGSYLLWKDGQSRGCEDNGACREDYEATAFGIAVTAAGAALLATGIYMFAKDRSDTPPLRAGIAPTPGGAIAGMGFTF